MIMAHAAHSNTGLASVARIGVFAALAFGVNAPFLAIPNVETFSLALFLSGLFLGIYEGLSVAFIAGLIFIFFNPNGPQTILLAGLAQLIGFELFALGGGILRPWIFSNYGIKRNMIILTISGALLTLWYDFTTNLVFAILFGPFWAAMIAGIGFGIIHFISNTVLFALSTFVIGKIWKRIEYIMPPLAR